MKKIGSANPKPSAIDTRLLQAAIDEYGLSELYLIVEWIFKQKNNFWRDRFKKAGRPCSFLVGSLPSIKKQFDEQQQKKGYWAKQRNLSRSPRDLDSMAGGPKSSGLALSEPTEYQQAQAFSVSLDIPVDELDL